MLKIIKCWGKNSKTSTDGATYYAHGLEHSTYLRCQVSLNWSCMFIKFPTKTSQVFLEQI